METDCFNYNYTSNSFYFYVNWECCNFVITLDDLVKSVEDVEKLKMFKLVIAPKELVLYKELKKDNSLSNVIFQ